MNAYTGKDRKSNSPHNHNDIGTHTAKPLDTIQNDSEEKKQTSNELNENEWKHHPDGG